MRDLTSPVGKVIDMLRLLEYPRANTAFYHESIAVHLYSMEELCFLLESKTYLLDAGWFNENLFLWLEQELKAVELSVKLRTCLRKEKDVFACAALLLAASGIYDERQLKATASLLEHMRGKTVFERKKMRGDLLLEEGNYRAAAYVYMELLDASNDNQMTEELRGNLQHNLGVIYARMFLFAEAAQLFSTAYRLGKKEESRSAYLFAMNFVEDSFDMEDSEMDLNFAVMRSALSHFSEATEDPANQVEQKRLLAAQEGRYAKRESENLRRQWVAEFRSML